MESKLDRASDRVSQLPGSNQTTVSGTQPLASAVPRWCRRALGGACSFLLVLSCGVAPAAAAERLTLRIGPVKQSVAVSDLEQFAETGELPPSMQPFAPLLKPQLRQLLTKHLQIDPSLADQFLADFLQSPDGERLFRQLSQALPGSSLEELQATFDLALQQADGLSAISFLRAYPEETIAVDLTSAVGIAARLNLSYLQSKILSPLLEQKLKINADASFHSNFDPTARGNQPVQKRTLVLRDHQRQRTIPVDIYSSPHPTGPMVVMSHGFAADSKFLAYLGRHLASYGFTVASLEHPGSNIDSFLKMSMSSEVDPSDLVEASEYIDRPKDVSFLLDELEKLNQNSPYWEGKFNTQQVSVIGHSLGGYTALALAGGELDFKELRSFCRNISLIGRSPADWLQCAATDWADSKVQLRDPRVVQVIAFNPVIRKLFGDDGLAQVSVPTLIYSGGEDVIAPALNHQLRPFDQLQGEEKYLITASSGTHLSITDPSNLNSLMEQNTLVKQFVGSEAEPVRELVRGVSLAFVKQLTPKANLYQPFLTPAYAQFLSTPRISMRLTTELPVSMDVWIQGLAFGNRMIARRQPLGEQSFLSSLQEQIMSATRKLLPSTEYCTARLDQIFTSLSSHDRA
ncbi:MAG: dienelactone hydrolase [Cyanobacteria bacterium QS_7_48_42]|nr:MAG: dienelactone hydrolase [Cyanobacteria bacterium QS_7_48_42]